MNLSNKSLLSDVLLLYSNKREVTPQTAKAYVVALRVLINVTGLRTVGDMAKAKPGPIQDAFDDAAKEGTYAKKTLSMALVLGKGLRNFLRLRELVQTNCFDAVKVRVGNNVPEGNVLKPGQDKLILNWLVPSYNGLNLRFVLLWRAVFLMLVRHGLRVHELVKLRREDVTVNAEGVRVMSFRGKGNKLARMAVWKDAWEAVEKWRAFQVRYGDRFESDFVIAGNELGRPLSRGHVSAVIGWVTERVLGNRVTPHGLRATFISQRISEKGIEYARKLARHSSLTTTQRYSRWEVLDV